MTAKKDENMILLRNVRTSYLFCFKPYENDGKSSYCTHAIFDEKHPQMAELGALIKKVAQEVFKEEATITLQQLKAQDKLCIHRGDVNKPGIDAYKGKVFVSMNAKNEPKIFNGDRSEWKVGDPRPESGDYCNVLFRVWGQTHAKFGKRINAEFKGIQLVKKGDPLSSGGRAAQADEFDVVAADADGDAPDTDSGGLI